MSFFAGNFLGLGDPDDKGDLLPFGIIGYGQGNTAIDGSHQEVHLLVHDQFFGHAEGDVHLELVIPVGEFNLRPQNAFLIDLAQGQFEAVQGILAINRRRPGVGVDDSDFNGALRFRTGRLENQP